MIQYSITDSVKDSVIDTVKDSVFAIRVLCWDNTLILSSHATLNIYKYLSITFNDFKGSRSVPKVYLRNSRAP